jgi:hypothetical protein
MFLLFGEWSRRVLTDVAGADAAADVEQAAMVFVAGWAVVWWGNFLAGFGGLLDERLPDAQNGWLAVALPG